MKQTSGSSRKAWWILAAILALGAIYWFGLRTDPKVAALNQAIEAKASPALRDYP